MDRTTIVDPDHHRAHDVGDEPLLIAREALTVITRRRLDGARTLIENGADLIIMDDGFQSAALKFDYALMVIDSVRGIGNGFLVPAGPVRAPTALQLTYSTALLKLGDGDAADPFIRSAARSGKPIYEGMVRPVGDTAAAIEGSRVLAFAGIADPKKFYRTVKALGAEIVAKRSFGDHQHLTDDEIADILSTAEKKELDIVTTAKDAARLRGHHGAAEELLARITVIDVEMAFDAPNTARQIINEAYENFRKRRLAAKKG
jgi:tetraacyldisaccharide 4'-kinase